MTKTIVDDVQFIEEDEVKNRLSELEYSLIQEKTKLKKLERQKKLLELATISVVAKFVHQLLVFAFFLSLFIGLVSLAMEQRHTLTMTDTIRVDLAVGLGVPLLLMWLRSELFEYLYGDYFRGLIRASKKRSSKIAHEIEMLLASRSS